MPNKVRSCANDLLDLVPVVMQSIREEMRNSRTDDLSVPQFRSLTYIGRHPGRSLSALADHLGLTLPSTSKLVDGLVDRGLVLRQSSTVDRRQVTLALSPSGEALSESARENTRTFLERKLSVLDPLDLDTLQQSLEMLRPLFSEQQVVEAAHNE